MLAGSTRFAMGSQCIDQNMTLASFHALVPVEAADSAAFGRLYRLAIHNDNGWTLRPTRLCPCLLVECCLDAAPDARILPLSEVVIHGAPGWKFTGDQAPLTPGPQ